MYEINEWESEYKNYFGNENALIDVILKTEKKLVIHQLTISSFIGVGKYTTYNILHYVLYSVWH